METCSIYITLFRVEIHSFVLASHFPCGRLLCKHVNRKHKWIELMSDQHKHVVNARQWWRVRHTHGQHQSGTSHTTHSTYSTHLAECMARARYKVHAPIYLRFSSYKLFGGHCGDALKPQSVTVCSPHFSLVTFFSFFFFSFSERNWVLATEYACYWQDSCASLEHEILFIFRLAVVFSRSLCLRRFFSTIFHCAPSLCLFLALALPLCLSRRDSS